MNIEFLIAWLKQRFLSVYLIPQAFPYITMCNITMFLLHKYELWKQWVEDAKGNDEIGEKTCIKIKLNSYIIYITFSTTILDVDIYNLDWP